MKFLGPLPPLMDTVRCCLAEFVGTFALVFIGVGAILALGPDASAGTLEIALAFGLVIAVMVTSVAHISGGHFNPAITFGFMVTRRIAILLGLIYIIVQMGAAVLATLLLKWIFPEALQGSLGAPSLTSIDVGPGLVVEAMITFFLVWVVFAMRSDDRSTYGVVGGLAIGFAITFGMLFAAPLTSGVMNPARAFGPQLIANSWTDFWIWYVGPLAGGAIAALLYDEIYLGASKSDEAKPAKEERESTPPPPPPPPPRPAEPTAEDRPPA